MIHAHHLTAGAHPLAPLVRSDADRHDLLDRIGRALGEAVLGDRVMDTHLHVVAEGLEDDLARRLTDALHRYTRAFNLRHGLRGRLLRGPVASVPSATREQLATTIAYNHDNPVRTRQPIAARAIDYPWSSARAFAGVSVARHANVRRALDLLGTESRRARRGLDAPRLADLEPVAAPRVGLDLLLGAAAAAHGVAPEDVAGPGRAPELIDARASYILLARAEGFTVVDAGAAIGRSKAQASRLGSRADAPAGARVARTLLLDPALRRTLRAPLLDRAYALPQQMQPAVPSEGVSHARGL